MPAVQTPDSQYAASLTQHGHCSFNADTSLLNRGANCWCRATTRVNVGIGLLRTSETEALRLRFFHRRSWVRCCDLEAVCRT
jgi:hypothetical protein